MAATQQGAAGSGAGGVEDGEPLGMTRMTEARAAWPAAPALGHSPTQPARKADGVGPAALRPAQRQRLKASKTMPARHGHAGGPGGAQEEALWAAAEEEEEEDHGRKGTGQQAGASTSAGIFKTQSGRVLRRPQAGGGGRRVTQAACLEAAQAAMAAARTSFERGDHEGGRALRVQATLHAMLAGAFP